MTGAEEIYKIISADSALSALIVMDNIYTVDVPDTLDKSNDIPWGVINDLPGSNEDHAGNRSFSRIMKVQVAIWVPKTQDNVSDIEQALDDALEPQKWFSDYEYDFIDTTYDLLEITRRYVKSSLIARD